MGNRPLSLFEMSMTKIWSQTRMKICELHVTVKKQQISTYEMGMIKTINGRPVKEFIFVFRIINA